ncbi:hypothetical protein C8F01DRAFT_45492 [Mycena amicta]|nr:hypothetical protein C8F01DRAFT_45492 [Mycena amicta]
MADSFLSHRFSDAPDALKSCASSASACPSTFRHDDAGSRAVGMTTAGESADILGGYETLVGSVGTQRGRTICFANPAFDSSLNPPPPSIVNTAFSLRVRRTPGSWVAHSSCPWARLAIGRCEERCHVIISTGAGRGGWVPAVDATRSALRTDAISPGRRHSAAPTSPLPARPPFRTLTKPSQSQALVPRPPSPLHDKSTLGYCGRTIRWRIPSRVTRILGYRDCLHPPSHGLSPRHMGRG